MPAIQRCAATDHDKQQQEYDKLGHIFSLPSGVLPQSRLSLFLPSSQGEPSGVDDLAEC
jgi:hypothetical protein